MTYDGEEGDKESGLRKNVCTALRQVRGEVAQGGDVGADERPQ
jgi:hypothetical protein